ncbi:MAG: nitroreductase family deazaflavin-dependent oxidoreductase [Chloroflexi bacterium]|nr:nitroreductase family deazaflavin-dependent oxidoreductase [Chloroflexota bacterium]
MSRSMQIGTAVLAALIRAGVPVGPLRLLSVRGRKSGKIYTTPIALVEEHGDRYLVAPFGEVGWVRNIRASGQGVLRGGRSTEIIRITELNHTDAAPILKLFRTRFGLVPFVPPYFEATPESPLKEFEQEAPYHPVFRIE